MQRYTLPLLAMALGAAPTLPAMAQNLFAPHTIVNGSTVTEWEVQQRTRFLTLLRAPGDIPRLAVEGLIDDRLRADAAKQAGIEVPEADVENGMEEFAQRANLTTDQFVAQLASAGVDRSTFRDFVRAGVLWRNVVRERFAARVVINEADINRAVQAQLKAPSIRVLLSELILPAPPGQEAQALQAAEDIAARVEAGESFASFAQQYSAAPSGQNGGQLEWLALSQLPPALQPVFLGLSPGGVTQPLQVPNAIALFQLRAIDESAPTQRASEVDFARYPLPAENPAQAAAQLRLDTCNDLYAAGRKNGVAVQRQTLPESQLPADLAQALSGLDENERTMLTTGGTPTLVMLCTRQPVQEEAVDRDAIRQQLTNQQLGALANVYLSQLRDNAIITTP